MIFDLCFYFLRYFRYYVSFEVGNENIIFKNFFFWCFQNVTSFTGIISQVFLSESLCSTLIFFIEPSQKAQLSSLVTFQNGKLRVYIQ